MRMLHSVEAGEVLIVPISFKATWLRKQYNTQNNLPIYSLFKDGVSSSGYLALRGTMISE